MTLFPLRIKRLSLTRLDQEAHKSCGHNILQLCFNAEVNHHNVKPYINKSLYISFHIDFENGTFVKDIGNSSQTQPNTINRRINRAIKKTCDY